MPEDEGNSIIFLYLDAWTVCVDYLLAHCAKTKTTDGTVNKKYGISNLNELLKLVSRVNESN